MGRALPGSTVSSRYSSAIHDHESNSLAIRSSVAPSRRVVTNSLSSLRLGARADRFPTMFAYEDSILNRIELSRSLGVSVMIVRSASEIPKQPKAPPRS